MKAKKQNLNTDEEQIISFPLDEETEERWSAEEGEARMRHHYTETREEIYMLCKIAHKKIQDLNFMVDEMDWPQSQKMEILLRTYTGQPTALDS